MSGLQLAAGTRDSSCRTYDTRDYVTPQSSVNNICLAKYANCNSSDITYRFDEHTSNTDVLRALLT